MSTRKKRKRLRPGDPSGKYPLVRIEWADAATLDYWKEVADIDADPQPCVSVGYLVRETKRAVCLSGTLGGEDACASIIIPKGCITRRSVIGR